MIETTDASTYYAPSERLDRDVLLSARKNFLANETLVRMLDVIPDIALVLTVTRQTIVANRAAMLALGVDDVVSLIGSRPGELVCCIHAETNPSGCGTGVSCSDCCAVNAIMQAIDHHEKSQRKGTIFSNNSKELAVLYLDVSATSVVVDGFEYIIVVMRDLREEKRRQVLERVFFHDVLNTAGGLYGFAQILLDDVNNELNVESKREVFRLSAQIVEEIVSHRNLLAAEFGQLQVTPSKIGLNALVETLRTLYNYHPITAARLLDVKPMPPLTITTDVMLLKRVLSNLLKNALEAIPDGEVVTVSAEQVGDDVRFHIHNPGVMSPEVQQQLFHRSFSTKAGDGRGIGTYSIKLFTEHYLAGKVAFTSDERSGTTFTVTLPIAGPPLAATAK